MSWFLVIGIAIALLVPLLTNGSYTRLLALEWRWPRLLALGVGLQIVVDRIDMPFRLGFALLVASYVVLLGFCVGNVIHRGMAVVAIGIGVNFLAIALNGGMPVRVPPDWAATGGIANTVKHHAQDSRDHLTFLGDIIVLRALDEAISFGDLILVVGLCDVTYQASRRPRRARAGTRPARSASTAAAAPPRSRPRPAFASVRVLPKTASTATVAPEPARSASAVDSVDLTAEDPVAATAGRAGADAALERFEHA